MSEEEPADWDLNWDEDAAAELIGKLALFGLTQLNASGTVVNKWQLHGRIIEAHKGKGIVVALEDVNAGRTWYTVAFNECLSKSAGGLLYAVIHDPDLVATWRLDNRPL